MAAPAESYRVRLITTRDPFARPWWAQRMAARDPLESRWEAGVAGRQGGKTTYGVWRILQIAAARPRGTSLLLVPTYRMGLVPLERLREQAKALGGKYRQEGGYLDLDNGHRIWVRSTDRPDAARGLTIDSVLWADEAALIPLTAWHAALGCLAAAKDPVVILTTTPRGRNNWLYPLWTGDTPLRRFAFRTIDSPCADPSYVQYLRATMSTEAASQELEGLFTDSSTQAFDPESVGALFADLGEIRGTRRWIGVDLAKEKHWTVATLMNEHGESWILRRWQPASWADMAPDLAAMARRYKARLVMDHGAATGYGATMIDLLEKELGGRQWIEAVKTANPGTKAQMLETLSADVAWGRIRVHNRPQEYARQLRHELLMATRTIDVKHGLEVIRYEGPVGEGEFDDCMVSLGLANFGRMHFGAVRQEKAVAAPANVRRERWRIGR